MQKILRTFAWDLTCEQKIQTDNSLLDLVYCSLSVLRFVFVLSISKQLSQSGSWFVCNTYAVWLQYTVTCNSFRGASDVWYWIFVANFLSLIVARSGVTRNLGHSSEYFLSSLECYIDCQCSNPYGLTATYKANKLPGEEVKECFFQCTPLHSSWSSPHASHLPV